MGAVKLHTDVDEWNRACDALGPKATLAEMVAACGPAPGTTAWHAARINASMTVLAKAVATDSKRIREACNALGRVRLPNGWPRRR